MINNITNYIIYIPKFNKIVELSEASKAKYAK